jgi:hypothetical protein
MIVVKAILSLETAEKEIKRVPMSRLPGELPFDEVRKLNLTRVALHNAISAFQDKAFLCRQYFTKIR